MIPVNKIYDILRGRILRPQYIHSRLRVGMSRYSFATFMRTTSKNPRSPICRVGYGQYTVKGLVKK